MKEKAIDIINQLNEFVIEFNSGESESISHELTQFAHLADFCTKILNKTAIAKETGNPKAYGLIKHPQENIIIETLAETAIKNTPTLQLSKAAKEYYESTWPKRLYSGYEKYVLTNGIETTFVRNDYVPDPGEAVFYCKAINQKTIIQLHRM
jgi:hypothetical protein